MPIDIGRLKLCMGPRELGAPDDLLEVIVDFIDGAQATLDVAVQELDSKPIAEALIRARKRGIKIHVVLEGDYLSVSRPTSEPWLPGGTNEVNREIHAALLRAKIDVKTDFNPYIFHQKFIVCDHKTSKASVLSGSTNFTKSGVSSNFNHIVVIKSKRVARVYAEEFDEIQNGTFGSNQERRFTTPRSYKVSGVRVKILFAPDHSPEMEIMKQMLKAKRSIDFAIYTFTHTSGIDDTLIAQAHSGIKVRGILDGLQGNQKWAPTSDLKTAGTELYLCPHGDGVKNLHHKLAVIDSQILITGSFNFTEPANRLNDENILVIGIFDDDEAEARQLQLGTYATNEINRIIENYGRPA